MRNTYFSNIVDPVTLRVFPIFTETFLVAILSFMNLEEDSDTFLKKKTENVCCLQLFLKRVKL